VSTNNAESASGAGAAHVTLEVRADQRLIPHKESFRHLDLAVRATRAAGAAQAAREPLTLALVLDRSGSMSGGKVETAKRAALAVLERLDERDTVAVVVFDEHIDVLQPAASVTAAVKRTAREKLAAIGARGSTALHEGWLKGCQTIASTDLTPPEQGVWRCFLLTDGQANVGLIDPEQIASQAADIRERTRIGTSTFGIGDDYAEELLGPMAEAGGGRFHHLRTESEIATTFVNELGELLATAASSIKLELEVEPGVIVDVVSTFWATPMQNNAARWSIALGDLFDGEERHAVVRLGFADQPRREEQAVRARVLWTAGGAEHASEWTEVRFTYADEAAVAAEPVDASVIEAAGQHLADRTHREAIRLSKSGDIAGARRTMSHSRDLLAGYALASPSLAPELADIDERQRQIEEGPLDPRIAKEAYFQRQMRSSGKRDLRGPSAPAPDPRKVSADQAQRLLADYIKTNVTWPQPLPDALPGETAEVVRDRVRGCLLSGAMGDALGRPLQGLTRADIRQRFGTDGLTRYLPPREWRSGPTGIFTGDTSLALELARSLVAGAGQLQPDDFARRLARQYGAGRAIGASTNMALERLAYGDPWWQAADRRVTGCAAAVRAAPVGLVHALDANPLALRQQAVLSALPTHSHAQAVAGAVALAAGVAWLLRTVASGAERVDAAALAHFAAEAVAGIEPPATNVAPTLAQRLRDLPTAITVDEPTQAFAGIGYTSAVVDTVPLAFYHFLRAPESPRQVVLAAANGGGCASAIASMAGQLAGVWCGAERLWRDATSLWDELEARDDVRELGSQLATMTLRVVGR
jgi:Ca-activated chloride channel homolog